MQPTPAPLDVVIGPMDEADLGAADHIMRLAFGTFLGMPEPTTFMGDTAYVRTRWRADRAAAFVARAHADVVGSNFAATWGSFGFFGPLTVRPDLWNQGVARRLIEPVLACFDERGVTHAGLFTFAHSQKHISLYQKFNFWPRYLTAIMSRPVDSLASRSAARDRAGDGANDAADVARFSDASGAQRDDVVRECRELTDAIFSGLDVTIEIRSVAKQTLGDTILVRDGGTLAAFAIAHAGAGTEAGSGTCYVKFAAVRPGARAERNFDRLLAALESFAADRQAGRVVVGVNTAREEAYRRLLSRGFRTDRHGVAMERPSDGGYNRRGVYVIDDWR